MTRIAVTSVRRTCQHFSMKMACDFEDAFCECTGAELIELPTPPADLRRTLARKLSWFPKLHHPAIDGGLDLLVIICMAPNQVTPLDYIHAWRRQCKRVVLYLFDCWPTPRMMNQLRKTFAEQVDLLALSFAESVPIYADAFGVRTEWVPQAVNPRRFRDRPGPRPVFACAMGRQLEPFFEDARRYCAEHDLFFLYQGEIGGYRRSWQASYDLYASILRHSQYVLNWSGKATHAKWAEDFRIDPLTCRWFEAAAAGGIQIGIPPDSPSFAQVFPDAPFVDVREFGGEAAAVFEHLRTRDQGELAYKAAALAKHVCRRHTWYNRVQQILAAVGMTECCRPPADLTVPLER